MKSILLVSLIVALGNAVECVGDTFLPLFPGETDYSPVLRGIFYFVGMVWFFLGIAIAADKFMEAISVITSKTKIVYVGGEEIEVTVWNETVANLTLMALGSSAPEILLATIETVALGFEAGELGPGTIVGSAAFNLLVITAICVAFIPERDESDPEKEPGIRYIKELGVFAITAGFSIFAYIWLYIVLAVSSPDEIELWEAIATLTFFPILVIVAYMQDRKIFDKCRSKKVEAADQSAIGHILNVKGSVNPEVYLLNAIRAQGESELSNAVIENLARVQAAQNFKHNRLSYRLAATQKVRGGKNLMLTNTLEEKLQRKITIGFAASHYNVLENAGSITLSVERKGDLNCDCYVNYHTKCGTAMETKEYEAKSGQLYFANGVESQSIQIKIIDNDVPQPDRTFKVVLKDPQFGTTGSKMASQNETSLGDEAYYDPADKYCLNLGTSEAGVTIVDDDNPGLFQFCQPTFAATEKENSVKVTVKRSQGCAGHVDIEYETSDGNATKEEDYEQIKGTLKFEPGEVEKSFVIPIRSTARFEQDLTFQVALLPPTGHGVKLGRIKDTTITLTNDEDFKKMVDKFAQMLKANENEFAIGTNTWAEQFRDAMTMPEPEDGEEHTKMDYVLHALSFYWKLIMAIIPPTSYWNGWATFLVSLTFIGVITAMVGDLAGMFGCCIGIVKPVTAITFIALGTSIPDTFASKLAATADPYADAAIGNVTGSNSVNVFLGLGFPWLLASLYHTFNGTAYEVPAGSLGFSVAIFTACAVLALVLLAIKRKVTGAELGGEGFWRKGLGALLTLFWFIYVLLSSLQVYGHI